MPVYRQSVFFKVPRNIKAFLRVEAGVTRGEVPDSRVSGIMRKQMEQARRELANKDAEISRLQSGIKQGGVSFEGAVDPAKVVWIFGTARTGSTWLASMMEDLEGHRMWNEPLVGALFGKFHYGRAAHKQGRNSLFRSGDESRARLVRAFVLMAIGERFPGVTKDDYIIIKEPNGSVGAPLLMEALPESHMILLVRDPRDVVSSNLGAKAKDGWFRETRERQGRKSPAPLDDPDKIVRGGAKKYRNRIGKSKQAYDAHKGPRVLVRYEELRADTLGTMKRIYSELDIQIDEEELAKVVEKHSWENIPEERKGPGKRNRKATPGGWREDLTPEQVKVVERVTAPLLKEFYPDRVEA